MVLSKTDVWVAFRYVKLFNLLSGQLAGNAFGFNYHGVITTMNGLYPKYVRTDGVGKWYMYNDYNIYVLY